MLVRQNATFFTRPKNINVTETLHVTTIESLVTSSRIVYRAEANAKLPDVI